MKRPLFTSELQRIKADITANLCEDGTGVLVEDSKYRAAGPTRTMVYHVAEVLGYRARTSVEEINGKYYLWYKLTPREA